MTLPGRHPYRSPHRPPPWRMTELRGRFEPRLIAITGIIQAFVGVATEYGGTVAAGRDLAVKHLHALGVTDVEIRAADRFADDTDPYAQRARANRRAWRDTTMHNAMTRDWRVPVWR